MKIRLSDDRLFFLKEIPIPVKTVFILRWGPAYLAIDTAIWGVATDQFQVLPPGVRGVPGEKNVLGRLILLTIETGHISRY